MTSVESALRRIVADLGLGGHDFALVGGLAVSARADPRFTRDADLVVSVADDDAAERVLQDLIGRGYRLVSTVEHDRAGRLATARLASPVAPDEELIVDLLFAASGVDHPRICARTRPRGRAGPAHGRRLSARATAQPGGTRSRRRPTTEQIEGDEPAVTRGCQREQVGVGDLGGAVKAAAVDDRGIEQTVLAGPELVVSARAREAEQEIASAGETGLG